MTTAFAIVPAAGRSTRMKRAKLLLPWRQATIIERVIAAWLEGGVDRVVAVVSQAGRLADLCLGAGAEVVAPAVPPPEMKDSIAAGLAHVEESFQPTADDAWLTAPADLPSLSPLVIRRLLAAHDSTSPRILAPVCGGRRGHPVLFPWRLAGEVSRLADDEGVNVLLRRHEVKEVACGKDALPHDVDTPDDYRRATSPGRP